MKELKALEDAFEESSLGLKNLEAALYVYLDNKLTKTLIGKPVTEMSATEKMTVAAFILQIAKETKES